jgi:actin-like ATPase involved in cell morphogenesis
MSKVYADQVAKAQFLVAGLKKNFELVSPRGISKGQIERLQAAAKEAAEMNQKVEALREEVRMKAAIANKKLTEVKNGMTNAKQIVKRCFEQERWIDFGVTDKR